MSTRGKSRRTFLIDSVTGLSGAWVAANYSGIMAAEKYVLRAAQSGQPAKFGFFTPEQAGAREARVINFIDRALTTFAKNDQARYTKGIDELQAQTKQMFPTAAKFSA